MMDDLAVTYATLVSAAEDALGALQKTGQEVAAAKVKHALRLHKGLLDKHGSKPPRGAEE